MDEALCLKKETLGTSGVRGLQGASFPQFLLKPAFEPVRGLRVQFPALALRGWKRRDETKGPRAGGTADAALPQHTVHFGGSYSTGRAPSVRDRADPSGGTGSPEPESHTGHFAVPL